MIKQLYFPFLVYGLFLWHAMTYIWNITEPDAEYYVGVGCGLLLSCVSTVLCLFQPRLSAAVGAMCLLVSAPLFFNILMAVGLTVGLITPFLLISLIAFVIAVAGCVRVLLKGKRPDELNNKAKIAFCILPFLSLAVLMFIHYSLGFT